MTPRSRRTFLRAAGVALALPWLESLLPRGLRAAPATTEPPLRLAFIFFPNGAWMQHWTPAVEGGEFALNETLKPLKPFQDQLLVLSGLAQMQAAANGDGAGDHARSAAAFLTGEHPTKTAGAELQVGISADQWAARKIGHLTSLPSLELGCDPSGNSGNCDSGYSCAYTDNISWKSPTTPMGKEVNPRAVFERLFGRGGQAVDRDQQARRLRQRRSVLDFAGAESKRLAHGLDGNDRRKLDEYLEALRSVERRLQAQESSQNNLPPPGYAAPHRVPKDYTEHVRLMYDMLALAFRTDQTRIATFMLAREGSDRAFPFIGVPEGHHHVSHHKSDPSLVAAVQKIDRFYSEQFAYFLDKLRTAREGDGTLLDNCLILYGGGISDGNRHNHDELPILLAGGGKRLRGGRHLRYPPTTPLNNLFLRLFDLLGLEADELGDSSGLLDLG